MTDNDTLQQLADKIRQADPETTARLVLHQIQELSEAEAALEMVDHYLHTEVPEDYPHADWMMQIRDHVRVLNGRLNNRQGDK